ncbi:twitch domain-containing radical SAM protein [bacterium]|nr:twitch domain-containing radical SAM protein [bacterium]
MTNQSRIFKNNPNFCPAPFTGMVQDSTSLGGPCPYNSGGFYFKDVPIKERWSHSTAEKLREQHLAGEKPALCERCYKEEAAGFPSRRELELTRLHYSEDEFVKGVYKKGPKTIVLRLSNNCNYACRTCHSVDSSLFKAEGEFYQKNYQQNDNRYLQTSPRSEFTSDDMEQFFELSQSVDTIEFYGGEPMMNTTHHILLDKLIKSGRSKNISLYYCTNGSFGPTDVRKEIWDKFKTIRFHFSLDGVNQYYHYIRWPGQWEKVEKNISDYYKILPRQISAEVVCGVNTTVSMLNIYYADEILNKISEVLNSQALAFTTVHEPQYYSVTNIPERCKLVIADKLRKSPNYEKLSSLVSYMFSKKCNPEKWNEFVIWTEKKINIAIYLYRTTYLSFMILLNLNI